MSWIRRLLKRSGKQSAGRPEPAGGGPGESTPSDLLERGIAHYRNRNWALAETLLRSAIDNPTCSALDREVGRNILGSLLERTRRPLEALAVHEANSAEHPQGSYSFERLAVLYRKLDHPVDAQQALARAIQATEQQAAAGRDVTLPLARLRELHAAALDEQTTPK